MAEVQRSAGTVRWFSGQKGFGFIAPDDSGDDLFVHQTEIRAEGFRFLREGQRVEFVVDSAEDGRNKAVDVVGLGRSSYRSGGGGRGRGRRDFGGKGGGGGGYGRFEGRSGGWRGGGRTGGRYAAGFSGGGGGAECYNCGRVGHLARDCYQSGDGGRGRGSGRNRGNGGDGDGNRGGYGGGHGGGGGGGSTRACYNCGEDGHFARDCPNVQN